MKKPSPQNLPPLNLMQEACLKTEYQKDGANIIFYHFHKSQTDGLLVEVEAEGAAYHIIFCNGKLRRPERRKIGKAALLCIRFDYFGDIEIGGIKRRGAFFNSKTTEVAK